MNEGDDSAANSSGHCRLRRRDTPHHLKGARINPSNYKAQQLNPDEMKEILERYTAGLTTNPQLASPGHTPTGLSSANQVSFPGSQNSLKFLNKPKVLL